MNEKSDFYVGYLPQASSALRHFLRKVVLALGLLAVLLAITLVLAQMPFAKSYFEFDKQRDFEGTLISEPYPELLVRRPWADGADAEGFSVPVGCSGQTWSRCSGTGLCRPGSSLARAADLSRRTDHGGS